MLSDIFQTLFSVFFYICFNTAMITNINLDNYLTRDLYEASYILSQNQKLLQLQKSDNFFFFVFENKKECELLRDNYWLNTAQVSAKQYANAVKELKKTIAQKRNDYRTY